MRGRIALAASLALMSACIDDEPIPAPQPSESSGRLSDAELGRVMRLTLRRDRIGVPDPDRRGLLAPVYNGQEPTHVQISIRTTVDGETMIIHTASPIPIRPLGTLPSRMENVRIDLIDYAMKQGVAVIDAEW